MWIAHLEWRHKKLIALALLSTAALWAAQNTPVWLGVVGVVTTMWGLLLLAASILGIWIRRGSFRSFGHSYEILDYYSLSQPLENRRVIQNLRDGSILSSLHFQPQDRWALLDIVRQFVSHVPKPLHRILVLGGGGGTVGNLLAQNKQTEQVDIVEISKTIIRIAKRYFFPTPRTNVCYYHADAAVFIHQSLPPYDLVFVDLFHGNSLGKAVTSAAFCRRVKKLVSPTGTLIMNLGYAHQFDRFIPRNQDFIYAAWYGSVVAFWSHNLTQTKEQIRRTKALIIPPSQ